MKQDRFKLEKSTQQGNWWVFTDIDNGIVIRFEERHFNENKKISCLNDDKLKPTVARDIARIMSEMGDWIVKYHSDICFDTSFGLQYSEDDEHLYLYRSKFPKWKIEVLESADKTVIASTLRKAAEFLLKR